MSAKSTWQSYLKLCLSKVAHGQAGGVLNSWSFMGMCRGWGRMGQH